MFFLNNVGPISFKQTQGSVKFMFSKKAAKIDEIFTVNLTLCSNCEIYGKDNFRNTYYKKSYGHLTLVLGKNTAD